MLAIKRNLRCRAVRLPGFLHSKNKPHQLLGSVRKRNVVMFALRPLFCKVLGRVFHYDLDEFRDAVYGGYDFRQLPDFGETLHNNIHDWFCVEDNFCIWEELQTMMSIQKPAVAEHSEDRVQDNPFVGKTIVVTGKVEPYTRDGINDLIESLGAHAGSSVSKKTDYLVCGENAGSKLSKARDLGVTVLSPAEFFSMAGAE